MMFQGFVQSYLPSRNTDAEPSGAGRARAFGRDSPHPDPSSPRKYNAMAFTLDVTCCRGCAVGEVLLNVFWLWTSCLRQRRTGFLSDYSYFEMMFGNDWCDEPSTWNHESLITVG